MPDGHLIAAARFPSESARYATIKLPKKASQSNSKCRFFSLPAEIRLIIYEFYIGDRKLLRNYKSRSDYYRSFPHLTDANLEGRDLGIPPSVLRSSANALFNTCRLAYQEGSHLFYQKICLWLYSGWTLYKFLGEMPLARVRIIREIRVECIFVLGITWSSTWHHPQHPWQKPIELFEWFTGLEILQLASLESLFNICGHMHFVEVRNTLILLLGRLFGTLKHLMEIRLTAGMDPRDLVYYTDPLHHIRILHNVLGWRHSQDPPCAEDEYERFWRVTEVLNRVPKQSGPEAHHGKEMIDDKGEETLGSAIPSELSGDNWRNGTRQMSVAHR